MLRGRNVDGWKCEMRDLPFFMYWCNKMVWELFCPSQFLFSLFIFIYIYIYHLIELVAFRALVEFGEVVVK